MTWLDDGLGADRARHPVRNAIVLLLTAVALYALLGDVGCDGESRSTCRTRRGGAGAIPLGLITLALAISLWHTSRAEAARIAAVSGGSVQLARATLPLSFALLSLGLWFVADGFAIGGPGIELAGGLGLLVFTLLTLSVGVKGTPRSLVPPPLRELEGA